MPFVSSFYFFFFFISSSFFLFLFLWFYMYRILSLFSLLLDTSYLPSFLQTKLYTKSPPTANWKLSLITGEATECASLLFLHSYISFLNCSSLLLRVSRRNIYWNVRWALKILHPFFFCFWFSWIHFMFSLVISIYIFFNLFSFYYFQPPGRYSKISKFFSFSCKFMNSNSLFFFRFNIVLKIFIWNGILQNSKNICLKFFFFGR